MNVPNSASASMKARVTWKVWLSVLCALAISTIVHADEEYTLGPDDVISINVWEHPELSRTVAVRANGTVTVPPMGDIAAAAKSTSVLARDLEREFYNVLRKTTQVTITVVAFNSQKVYLAGQVSTPGAYSFERIPNMVELLGQVGGLGPTADLSGVRVMRREGESQRTMTVDLTYAVESGDVSGVPPLVRNDVVFVPAVGLSATGAPTTFGGGVGAQPIYVVGQVGIPGPIPSSGNLTVIQALSLAGGSAPDANLKRIGILSQPTEGGSYLTHVNLERALLQGSGGPLLQPGDALLVPQRGANFGEVLIQIVDLTLDATRDILNIIAIYDVLDRRASGN